MQLRIARLCLDCEEIHDAQECPICASEVFAYLTRWVPVPEGAHRPIPAAQAKIAAAKMASAAAPSSRWKIVLPGVLGVGVLGIAGWLWRSSAKDTPLREQKRPGEGKTSAVS